MQLLKRGDRFLNVALVTEYTVEDTSVIVHVGPGHATRFTRHDATLLRHWLDRIATGIAQDAPDMRNDHACPVDRHPGWRDPDDSSRTSRR